MHLFGSSGIRRVADRSLVELALKAGLAVGTVYDRVVVGCDTRTSSDAVKHAFISGALAAGSECFDAGVVPTPTLALAAREFQAGAMITASHNPPEYNGIKLVNPDGSAFDAVQREQVERLISDDSLPAAPWRGIKSAGFYRGAIEKHIEHILRDFPVRLRLKVVLDCACGAASVITPGLLERMGCEVITMNCSPGGFFPHPVEPTEANLAGLIQATREYGADLGIAHDGDADRMMAVDDRGRFIPGDKLLVLFAEQAGARKMVTTVDASMVVEERGFQIIRTRVGDIYVSEELKQGGDFGGEPSGSWVFPGSSLCPDGIYAAARLVSIAGEQKISILVDAIPDYPLLRGDITANSVATSNLEKQLLVMNPLSVNNIDGVKLNFADGWLLVRASGTEPKIRITAEAASRERAQQLYDRCVSLIIREDKEK
ncbi:MAG: phosphoglucosamine mutase [Dehalococcoidales bacterium]|nr:phosphoglucosamine mutase [Dehalococcoidales bacterium]